MSAGLRDVLRVGVTVLVAAIAPPVRRASARSRRRPAPRLRRWCR
jgi:hypothetical protein